MKIKNLLGIATLGLVFGAQIVTAQDNYIINQQVHIPVSAAFGVGVARQHLPLQPGTYEIRLTVERASWDRNPNSVAENVGIGGDFLIKDRQTGRDVDKGGWFTRNGWLGWMITVPPNCDVYLFYSTIAPTGAAGRLTVRSVR